MRQIEDLKRSAWAFATVGDDGRFIPQGVVNIQVPAGAGAPWARRGVQMHHSYFPLSHVANSFIVFWLKY